MNVKMMNLKD